MTKAILVIAALILLLFALWVNNKIMKVIKWEDWLDGK